MYLSFQELLVKNLWIYPYKLIERLSKKEHEGVLLKVLFFSDQIGYGVLHPLPMFNKEESLSYHLQCLKNQTLTPLFMKTLESIKKDASFRSQNKNMMNLVESIQNHYLISNIFSIDSFDFIDCKWFKVKIGDQIHKETQKLRQILKNTKKDIKLRLDFNYKISNYEFKLWEKENKDLATVVEFIEDPFLHFSHFQSVFSFAWDWGEVHYCPLRIIKPSRHPLSYVLKGIGMNYFQRVFFTHACTHPLEARGAKVEASYFYKIHPSKKEVCGLNYPYYLFEKDEFIEQDSSPQEGTGLGYDNIFKKLSWKKWI